MKKVTINFKFDIEDMVIFKGTRGNIKKVDRFGNKIPKEFHTEVPAQKFMVLDRIVEQCYGGTQIHYNLRPIHVGENEQGVFELVGVHDKLIKAREIELELAK